MDAPRKHSRYAPRAVLRGDAEQLVKDAESSPRMRRNIEVLCGTPYSAMTQEQRINAVLEIDRTGAAAASLAAAARGIRDLTAEVDAVAPTQPIEQQVSYLEEQNNALRAEVEELKAMLADAGVSPEGRAETAAGLRPPADPGDES